MRIFILIFIFLVMDKCYGDNWVQKSNFPGSLRHVPTSFSIGGKGYIGQGRNPFTNGQFKDHWEYNPITDTWTKMADRGTNAYGAAGFSILNKGYSVGDVSGSLTECWEYDPLLDIWTQMADYPGNGVGFMGAKFEINNKGYVGLGGNGNWALDFWEFDPQTNTWSAKASMNIVRQGLASFSVLAKGYVGGGCTTTPSGIIYLSDFWEFDPLLNSWTQKANMPGLSRADAVGISINNKGYIGLGDHGQGGALSDFWEYDPVLNIWTQKTDYPGLVKDECAYFTIGNTGYVGIGMDFMTPVNEFWAYSPDTLSAIIEPMMTSNYAKIIIFPNPVKNHISIKITKDVSKAEVKLISSDAKDIISIKDFSGNQLMIDVASLPSGIYIIKVLEKNRLICSSKFIIE